MKLNVCFAENNTNLNSEEFVRDGYNKRGYIISKDYKFENIKQILGNVIIGDLEIVPGKPDFFAYKLNNEKVVYEFIEVKTPNTGLSENQIRWHKIAKSVGLNSKIIYVSNSIKRQIKTKDKNNEEYYNWLEPLIKGQRINTIRVNKDNRKLMKVIKKIKKARKELRNTKCVERLKKEEGENK